MNMNLLFGNGRNKMKYVIDIDGTICTQEKNYADAMPLLNRIEKNIGITDKFINL